MSFEKLADMIFGNLEHTTEYYIQKYQREILKKVQELQDMRQVQLDFNI